MPIPEGQARVGPLLNCEDGMIIVSTWKFLGLNLDTVRFIRGTIERNVGHAALQVTAGPNKGVYISWWPGGGWTPDEKARYASPNSLKEDMSSEAENRRNNPSKEYQQFLDAIQHIADSGGSDAELARQVYEAAVLGDTEEKTRLKFRPADQFYHIPSLADGALHGLDDSAIVEWWTDMNAQLKKAIDKGEYNKNAYYDLITHNCSDIVIQALIHGGGAKYFPSLAGWGIVTPDYVDKAGTNIMLGIAKKMEPYSEAVAKIEIDKKPNEMPKPSEYSEVHDELLKDGLDKKNTGDIDKLLAQYGKTKELNAKIDTLEALIIEIGSHLPAKGAKADKHLKTTELQLLANQALDTITLLLEERKKAHGGAVKAKAKKLWK